MILALPRKPHWVINTTQRLICKLAKGSCYQASTTNLSKSLRINTFYEKRKSFIQHPSYQSRTPGRPGQDNLMQNVSANTLHLKWWVSSAHIISLLNCCKLNLFEQHLCIHVMLNTQRKSDNPADPIQESCRILPQFLTRCLASDHPNAPEPSWTKTSGQG